MEEFDFMIEEEIEDFDIENDPVLSTFFQHLDELSKEPRMLIINPKRLKEFKYSFCKISEIARKTTPDAKITYEINDELNAGIGSIEVETDEFTADNIKEFISAIRFATNITFYPLTNGNIKIDISFNGMMNGL